MKHFLPYIFATIFCLLLAQTSSAEVVKLKSGSKITGTIIFKNDEAVVIKDASGARFQYMMSDVEAILEEDEETPQETNPVAVREKKATVGIELSGGLGMLPPHYISTVAPNAPRLGGDFQAELTIGSANLLDRRIILGGSFGYHLVTTGGTNYSFLPLQLKLAVPFSTNDDAPMVSASIGYGFAADKEVKGGVCASLALGWRRQLTQGRAFFMGVYASFQQAHGVVQQNVDGMYYTGDASCSSAGTGLRLGFFL